ILQSAPAEDIGRASTALLAEAIARLRAGKVIRDPGYDGEYGVIRLFEEGELQSLTGSGVLFDAPAGEKARQKASGRLVNPAVDESLQLQGLVPQRSLPPCGGGTGVATRTELAATPLPTPPPTQVGPARLAQSDAQPGQARVAWERKQTESAASANSNAGPASKILAQLDNNQRAAASSVEGPLLTVPAPPSATT